MEIRLQSEDLWTKLKVNTEAEILHIICQSKAVPLRSRKLMQYLFVVYCNMTLPSLSSTQRAQLFTVNMFKMLPLHPSAALSGLGLDRLITGASWSGGPGHKGLNLVGEFLYFT